MWNSPRAEELERELTLDAITRDGPFVARTASLAGRLLQEAEQSSLTIERALFVEIDEKAAHTHGESVEWLRGVELDLSCLGWDWVFPELDFSFVDAGAPTLPQNQKGLFYTREELAAHEEFYRQRFATAGVDVWEDPEGSYAVRLFEDPDARWLRSRLRQIAGR